MRTAKILHVENNRMVADLIRETLVAAGWCVETCPDGNVALQKIASDVHYDLLLLDHNLPGVNGMELLRRARMMAHRRHTPVVMFSFDQIDTAARRAGANGFLRKPEDIGILAETIERLVRGTERDCTE